VESITIIDAPLGTKTTHIYKYALEKLLKTIAAIRCNKICKIKQMIQEYYLHVSVRDWYMEKTENVKIT
jgi:hypothetical protein